MIAGNISRAEVTALARASKEDIDRAWGAIKDAAHPRIHTFIATSDIHLEHKLKKPQAYVSQQLRILKDAEIVDTDRDGVNIFYRLVDPLARRLIDVALGPIDARRSVDASCPCPRCSSEGCESTE